ncbi:unnamed protein product [Allacma fusca]|uniref:Uncharacterized protein n=1 Tax=Allacma fusca TaxID=39272 RepID=A0A8J2LGC4_9HEXA|nr:unnamed protein product [Allacma fusca]
MERYGYRDKARIISIVDMVWSTINLGQTFLGFLAVSAYSNWLNSVDPDHRKEWIHYNNDREGNGGGDIVFSPRALKKLAWMLVMAHFAIHFSQLTFAINLYTGTAKNATAKAPAACRLWFITSSLLLGILGLKLFFQARDTNVIFCMSEIIFRAVGMYIVGEYAKEVKNGAVYPPPPPVYFSSHPVEQPHLGHTLPIFMPAHRDLPPKYEEVMRLAPVNPSLATGSTSFVPPTLASPPLAVPPPPPPPPPPPLPPVQPLPQETPQINGNSTLPPV